ncbi:MAG TPA: hypothetical protein VF506_00170, partial [Streptosporangiaceae bacterium]
SLQRHMEIARKACVDPGSIVARKGDEDVAEWQAHAVVTALDCRGLLRAPTPMEPFAALDLAAVRQLYESYASLWREAQQDARKETFAILAACRAADQVPALVAALEAWLAASWRPTEGGD